jgi:SIR2-like domain/Effector-associated domain 11
MSSAKITPFDTPDWAALAESIGDGEAILLLGPDALPMYRKESRDAADNSLSFSQLAALKIKEHPKVTYSFYYERDNLFLFQDHDSKREAKKVVRQIARTDTWMPDNELLRQIATIPFSVVMSINPDLFIREAFQKMGVGHQFDYYSSKDKKDEIEIVPLNKERSNPILYNLCGKAEDLDSLILDYNDLFTLLKNVLNDLKVPDVLRGELRKADTYILLGFHFDRWDFQLLLHYLNMRKDEFDNSNKTFSILSELREDDNREFVMQQFNLKWIAPSREDFDNLYTACEQQRLLRPIHFPQSSTHAEVRRLIAQNAISSAFTVLEKETTDTETLNLLTLLRGRHTAWQEATNAKTEDSRDLAKEINQIRYTLLSLAAQIHTP